MWPNAGARHAGLAVAAHQSLCPTCRTPLPFEPGRVAASAEGSTVRVVVPPPRPDRTAPAAPDEATVLGPDPTRAWDRSGFDDAVAAPRDRPVSRPLAWVPAPVVPPQPPPPPPPVAVAPTPQERDRRGNAPGGVVGLLGAALVIVGVLLPWMEVGDQTVSGSAASEDAKVLLGLAGVAAVAAALVVGGARSLVLRVLLGLLGLVALVVAVFEMVSVARIDELDPVPGVGLLVGVAGGATLFVACALTRHRRFR